MNAQFLGSSQTLVLNLSTTVSLPCTALCELRTFRSIVVFSTLEPRTASNGARYCFFFGLRSLSARQSYSLFFLSPDTYGAVRLHVHYTAWSRVTSRLTYLEYLSIISHEAGNKAAPIQQPVCVKQRSSLALLSLLDNPSPSLVRHFRCIHYSLEPSSRLGS